jgi:hypothetical protein
MHAIQSLSTFEFGQKQRHGQQMCLSFLRVLLISVSSILLSSALASATTYYVATTGNDSNPGTLAQPWQHVQHAANVAVGGDTVNVRGGTYSEHVVFPNSGNASAGYITFQNFSGETPVFTGNTGQWFSIISKNYIKIIGMTFRDYVGGAITVNGQASHIEIRNNTILNQGNGEGVHMHAILASSLCWPNVCQMDNIIIDGNTLKNVKTGIDEAFNEAITVAFDVDTYQITNNTLDTIHYIGIDSIGHSRDYMQEYLGPHGGVVPIGTQPWPRNGYIARNTIFNGLNTSAGVPCAAIYFDGGQDTVVEYNTIHDWVFYAIVISSEEAGFNVHNVIVRYNTIYDSYVGLNCGNLATNASLSDTHCVHNTIYQSRPDYYGTGQNAYGNSIVWKNNISYTLATNHMQHYIGITDTPTMNYNLYYPDNALFHYQGIGYSSVSSYKEATGQDANSITDNPLFTNAAAHDFSLQTGSPAIDAGGFLTTAVGSGSNSTTLTVADAKYFSDGKSAVTGDTIRVGASSATVSSVNYSTNVITLGSPLTWSNGAGVSYPYNGSAPDMGAYEDATKVTALPSPGNLRITIP